MYDCIKCMHYKELEKTEFNNGFISSCGCYLMSDEDVEGYTEACESFKYNDYYNED